MKLLIQLLLIGIAGLPVLAQSEMSANRNPNNGVAGLKTPVARETKTEVNSIDECGCESQFLPDVLATVDGVKISSKEIEQSVGKRVSDLKQQVIAARTRELNLQVNSKLLAAEARRLGITATVLINKEVLAKVIEPTEAEAQAFYNHNKARIKAEFKDVKSGLIEHLRSERQGEEAGKFAERLRTEAKITMPSEAVTPPQNAADRARVFVTINGENITSGDIEDALRAGIFSVQEQVYSLREQSLGLKINDTLLEQEALRRKMTTNALLQAEIASKLKPVTSADARAFYELHKSELEGDFAKLENQILRHLEDVQERAVQSAFAEQLRRAASVQVFLIAPEPPVFEIATADQPVRGNAEAAVTIVEFIDFQCPSCASMQPVLESLVKEYNGKVRVVVRDFPLEDHADSFKAAEAAEAAREQGKYWEYTAILMANQSKLGLDSLKEFATRLGMDRTKFDAALESGKFADQVQQDLRDGSRYGVDATPTLFVNGRRVKDNSPETVKAAIEAALSDKAKK